MNLIKNLFLSLCLIVIFKHKYNVVCQQQSIQKPTTASPTTSTVRTTTPRPTIPVLRSQLCDGEETIIKIYTNSSIGRNETLIDFVCDTSINLANCNITDFTISLPSACNITNLNLTHNLINENSLQFEENLSFLSFLYLTYNRIKTLNNTINFAILPELEYLYLEQNELTYIDPTTFSSNRKLKEIHLENNKLKNIRFTLPKKTSLVDVYANGNSLYCYSKKDLKRINLIYVGDEECEDITGKEIRIDLYVVPLIICILALIAIVFVSRMLKNSDKPPPVKKRPKETYDDNYIDVSTLRTRLPPTAKMATQAPGNVISREEAVRSMIGESEEGVYVTVFHDDANRKTLVPYIE